MRFREVMNLVSSDLYRYEGHVTGRFFFKHYFWTPGFKYSVFLRLYSYARTHSVLAFGIRQFIALRLHCLSIKYGISISPDSQIGRGLYIGHYGGIVVNSDVRIGHHCNLSHNVTLGRTNRGASAGCPTVGNYVYVGPGAKIIGRVRIGDHAAVGANAVVVDDVPDYAVMAGVPAKVVSSRGSDGYVNRVDYSIRGPQEE
jgi:serine O-acetyltransferase